MTFVVSSFSNMYSDKTASQMLLKLMGEIEDRSICIDGDFGEVLEKLK